MMAAARVDNRPRRLPHPKAGAWHVRVKIIEPERAKKRPPFLEKREKGQKDSQFLEVLFKKSQKQIILANLFVL